MKVGVKNLDDAIININSFSKLNKEYGDKKTILKALSDRNYSKLRDLSNFYYDTSGIYQRLCKYMAFLYKYDWYIIPYIQNKDKVKENQVLSKFAEVLSFFDRSNLRKLCGNIALSIIKNGCYYGYLIDSDDSIVLQDLPIAYCRSRFNKGDDPTVEFNMKYFDDAFKDTQYRMRVLGMFPKDFQKGYVLYKEGKLKAEYSGDADGWYLLDPDHAVKFNFNKSDFPIFSTVIPSIIDLSEAQELDRKKMMQQLLKILIQKLPTDKNGELIFDIDEAKDLHNNAVDMLKRAVGVDIVTTFADMEVANLADRNSSTTVDDLEKVERGVFNEAGIAHNLFNTNGNTALDRSVLNDESSMRNIILQFEDFFNRVIEKFNKNKKKFYFKIKFLETTAYNYKDLSKLYKEQVQIGYSKMLPQLALGHSQSEILATINFENDILHLTDIMIPPIMSSVMSGKVNNNKSEAQKNSKNVTKTGQSIEDENDNTVGRKEKPDNEKSDKTLQNLESLG